MYRIKNNKSFWLSLAILLTCLTFISLAFSHVKKAYAKNNTAENKQTQQVQNIIDRGVLRVGVKQDVPNFGYLDPESNRYSGMEVDIAKKVAKNLGVKIEFTAVTAQTRGPLLDNGQLDMVIATFTITEERKALYNFSTPYYTDAAGFLVKKNSGINSWKDLNGKNIGVTQGSIQQSLLEEIAEEKGLHFDYTELGSNPEVVVALAAKRVDAFSIDKSILTGFLGKQNKILSLTYNPSEYGIVTKKSNTQLAAYFNGLVKDWKADGSLQTIYDKYSLKPTTVADK